MKFKTRYYINFLMTGVIFQIAVQNICELFSNPSPGQWIWTIFLIVLTAVDIVLDVQLVKYLKGE